MLFNEAMAYLNSYANMGSFYELDTVQALLDILENPEKELDIIHVAGTNGKGSVVAYLSSILKQNPSHKLASYTSPAARHYRDRFRYQGEAISEELFAQLVTEVSYAADHMTTKSQRHPTVFEMEVAIFYLGALANKTSLVIQETGLGGRLDATNVIKSPILTIITAIGLDHIKELGHELTDIAYEKAGIIKTGAPVVIYPNTSEVTMVVENIASLRNAPLHRVNPQAIVAKSDHLGKQIFYYKEHPYQIALNGSHQRVNAALAIEACNYLPSAYRPSQTDIEKGLEEAQWPGRLECIHTQPMVILDGAHNPQAAQALAIALKDYFPKQRITGLVHIFKDKDAAHILSPFAPIFSKLWVTSSNLNRSLSLKDLEQLAQENLPQTTIQTAYHFRDGVTQALKETEPSDVIVIFGSLSHLEESRDIVTWFFTKGVHHD